MDQRTLGDGLSVSAIGLGCMGMSRLLRHDRRGRGASRTIHRALELGCTFLDTAEMYGPYTNEELVGKALAGRRDEVDRRHQVRHPLRADRGRPDATA